MQADFRADLICCPRSCGALQSWRSRTGSRRSCFAPCTGPGGPGDPCNCAGWRLGVPPSSGPHWGVHQARKSWCLRCDAMLGSMRRVDMITGDKLEQSEEGLFTLN